MKRLFFLLKKTILCRDGFFVGNPVQKFCLAAVCLAHLYTLFLPRCMNGRFEKKRPKSLLIIFQINQRLCLRKKSLIF